MSETKIKLMQESGEGYEEQIAEYIRERVAPPGGQEETETPVKE